MKRKIGIAAVTFAFASAGAGTAFAQEYAGDYMRAPVRAPRGAFEIEVNTGYTQGFGDINGGVGVGTVADAGFMVGLTLAGRITPHFSLGAMGQFQEFNADDRLPRGTNTRGTNAGIIAVFHTLPFERLDPWISISSAFRSLWVVPDGPDNNIRYMGFEFAKVQIGLDVRASQDVAIAPFIGASIDMYAWRTAQGTSTGNVSLPDKRASSYIFAGLQGRFDMGGIRETKLTRVGIR